MAALFIAAGCASAPTRTTAPPRSEVTLETLAEQLSAYGEWIVVAPHGRVWRPTLVAPTWQPYLRGEWVWTDEGWFWLADEPWGWATYHYGRWLRDPVIGWVWVPGVEWAPAWVAWRVDAEFVGWAPLCPDFSVWWVDSYPVEPAQWVFVPARTFVGVRVENAALPRARVVDLLPSTRPAPPRLSTAASPAPRFGGPMREIIERQAGHRLAPARIVSVGSPADAAHRADHGTVPTYRPAPAPKRANVADGEPSSARPAPPAAEPARPTSAAHSVEAAPRRSSQTAAPPARAREDQDREHPVPARSR